jgi:hypothetical protein
MSQSKEVDANSRIVRIWKGWTTPENAPAYERLLEEEVFPGVKKKGVVGLEKVSISTRRIEDEVEFLLVLQFETLDAVRSFAGEDYEVAYIPDSAAKILSRYDATARHYELKNELLL